jgi:hypothetical protein
MPARLDELINDCLFGRASAEQLELVRADPVAAAALDALAGQLEAIAPGLDAPLRPGAHVSTTLAGTGRFLHFVPRLMTLFDLDARAVGALLEQLVRDDAWLDGPADGVGLLPVTAGPARRGLITTLLRLEPGARFPLHRHAAEERVLVLEGGYVDDQSGEAFWRAREDVRPAGSSHSLTGLLGGPCLCASVTSLDE